MKAFVFLCPKINRSFNSEKFKLFENNGVKKDGNGQAYLDAKVKLTEVCPFCGDFHEYHANQLSCPFS